jgi:hypothetical protein
MSGYVGDQAPASTVTIKFNTAQFSDGAPVTLAGTPAVKVYKAGSTTESTAGVTLTVDYDSRTGYHDVTIDTSADGTFYAAGNDFSVAITAGTVGGTSVVGREVGSFSLNNRSALRPATAGRQANVDASGRVLSDLDTIKTQSVTCAAGVTVSPFVGSTGAAINGTNANTLSGHDPGATLGTSTLTQTQVTGGAFALNSSSFAFNSSLDFTTTQKSSLNASTPASVTGAVGSVTAGVTLANGVAHGGSTATLELGSSTSTPAFLVNSSGGHAVKFASSATNSRGLDVSATGTGTASAVKFTSTNANGLYLSSGAVNGLRIDGITVSGFGEADLVAMAADTDEIQTELADGGRTDLLIDAIKVKTDNLPASPAAVGSAMTLTSGERDSIATALLDLTDGVESGITLRKAQRAMAAILAGIVSGAGSGTEVFKALAAASGGTTRVTVTVDSSGNRSAVTLNL